jgi:hypothetical protein
MLESAMPALRVMAIVAIAITLGATCLAASPARADYLPDINPGFEISPVNAANRLQVDLEGELGAKLRAAAGDDVLLVGAWEVRRGSWREFRVFDDLVQDQHWLDENVGQDPASLDGDGKPYGAGGRLFAGLAYKRSVRNPEVTRTWLLSFAEDPSGAVALRANYQVYNRQFDLDEEIDSLLVSKVYCLDFFGNGGMTLVLPWHFGRLEDGYEGTKGVDVINVDNFGGFTSVVDPIVLTGNHFGNAWCISDLNSDKQWELQTRFQIMPGRFHLAVKIVPNLSRGDWRVEYSPGDQFYTAQEQFYDALWNELLHASTHLPDFEEKRDGGYVYAVQVGGAAQDITELVEQRSLMLWRLTNFQEALTALQSLLLRHP